MLWYRIACNFLYSSSYSLKHEIEKWEGLKTYVPLKVQQGGHPFQSELEIRWNLGATFKIISNS